MWNQECDVATSRLMLSGYINRGIVYRTEEGSETFTLWASWPHIEYGVQFWQSCFSKDIYNL